MRPVLNLLASLGDRHVYLFIDDAGIHLDAVEEIATSIGNHINVTFVLCDRPHVVLPRLRRMRSSAPKVIEMPYLDRGDCERIIEKLEEFGVLGDLRGKSRPDQLRQFLGRSKKQLLVAMKEATSGKGFDVILTHEFNTLSGEKRQTRLSDRMYCLHARSTRQKTAPSCIHRWY
jgi:hypothetical protein